MKYFRIKGTAYENLSYYRSVFGYTRFDEIFENLKIPVTFDDVKKGLVYIKDHRKSTALATRVRHILVWIDKELLKDIDDLYKQNLLQTKMFCEEYMK